MGSGSSGGGSLSGGKTVLAGTFMAEQTHSTNSGGPASYTLVSMNAAEGRRNGPRVQASGGGAGNRGDRLRKARVEKGGLQCTKLAALQQIDSLLLPNEESEAPRQSIACSSRSQPAPKDGNTGSTQGGTRPATQQRCMFDSLGLEESIDLAEPVSLAEGDTEAYIHALRAKARQAVETLFAGQSSFDLQPLPPMEPVAPAGGRPASRQAKGSPKKLHLRGAKEPMQERGASAPAGNGGIGPLDEDSSAFLGVDASFTASASLLSSPPPRGHRGTVYARPQSQPASTMTTADEVFQRLYVAQKPWVAGRTDSQLLQYLAWRGGTPEIASPQRSAMGSTSRSSDRDSHSPSRCFRRQYRNHRELFDGCLQRDSSPSPPPKPTVPGRTESRKTVCVRPGTKALFSPQQLAKAQVAREQQNKLYDQIEDIMIIPHSAAEAFLEENGIHIPSSGSPGRSYRSSNHRNDMFAE